ncbi:MAG: class I SAM-dependent methyltransferase [Sphingobacteriales bacterium]|nr:MAG: class I SAM-dependent methyltransferase [Sphingobacteriales bacterium]
MYKRIRNYLRNRTIIDYVPEIIEEPEFKLLEISSAWKGHDLIIRDLITRFNLKTENCLEFGVEFGFSTVALSSYFDKVIGVDLFTGDIHTSNKKYHYEDTVNRLAPFKNINLIRADYKEYIKNDTQHYNLIHVDIVHTYKDTYDCGLWSAEHSDCTIFHDTESFSDVRDAVYDIAKKTGKKFYNYKKHYGLGIIV